MYFSERGNPLLTVHTQGKKMLTVEDQPKWYDLYLINEDGTVKAVPQNEFFWEGWRDHCIVPESFKDMAEWLGATYCEKTWEHINERYQQSLY